MKSPGKKRGGKKRGGNARPRDGGNRFTITREKKTGSRWTRALLYLGGSLHRIWGVSGTARAIRKTWKPGNLSEGRSKTPPSAVRTAKPGPRALQTTMKQRQSVARGETELRRTFVVRIPEGGSIGLLNVRRVKSGTRSQYAWGTRGGGCVND